MSLSMMGSSSSTLSRCLIVFLLLCRLPLACCLPIKMSFTYQSYLNDKSQWFTMFTLCLAPLVSHLALGLPRTVIMSPEPAEDSEPRPSSKPSDLYPHWSERIALFNPVTLVWRYYGI